MNKDDKNNPCLVSESIESIRDCVYRKKNKIIIKVRRQSQLQPMPTTPLQLDIDVSTQDQELNAFQHENLSIQLNNISNLNELPTQNVNPGTSTCNMCYRNDSICVNLQQKYNTVAEIIDITRLPSWNIREILSCICPRCLVYVTAVTESSTKLRKQCQQAMHSQSIVLTPPTPDTSPNNFLQLSTTLLDEAPPSGHSNEVQRQHNCYSPGYCNDTADELALPPVSPPTPNLTFNATSDSPASSGNIGNNHSMLKIQYERPVSPLNTESGGGGKNSKRNYQRTQNIPVQMICPHCNSSYQRKDYYKKHTRRCGAKFRYAKSVIPSQTRSESRIDLDAVSVLSEGNDAKYSSHPPRVYRCDKCTVTVDNIGKLRQHKRIHLPRFYCDICTSEFTTHNEYEFHRIECSAKMEVYKKGSDNVRNDDSSKSIPARRKTRSYSRALSVAPSLAVSKASSKELNKSKKKQNNNLAKRSRTQNEDEQSTITNFVKRHKHLYSEKMNNNEDNIQKDKNDMLVVDDDNKNDEDNEEDEDEDDVSQIDTLYSERLFLTNHWVEEHSLSSHSHLSQGDNYVENYVEDMQFRSLKEYDLHLLERLKVEVKQNFLTCFVPGCTFISETLNEIMVHDYIYHFKKPWFYCQKCGYCFTSKVFLDYHLDMQNKGRYVCYKCGSHFEYQHQLDHHLIKHERLASDSNEKYICKYCNFAFLDEDMLQKHCYEENHPPDKEKPIIKINDKMTISNKVPEKEVSNRRHIKKYEVKILNMVLKPMPSKRCTPMEKYRSHLPPHLRIPNRIGQVEFRHPLNPNCVGCL